MISGFSVLCCAKTDDLTPKQRYISSLVVVVIGVLQLLMVSCFLIGWIWSGIWGVSLIGNSGKIITIQKLKKFVPRWLFYHGFWKLLLYNLNNCQWKIVELNSSLWELLYCLPFNITSENIIMEIYQRTLIFIQSEEYLAIFIFNIIICTYNIYIFGTSRNLLI